MSDGIIEPDWDIIDRLRDGTASPSDKLWQLEYWRSVALNYGDKSRAGSLDDEIRVLREELGA